MFLNYIPTTLGSHVQSSSVILYHCTVTLTEIHCPNFCLLKLHLCPLSLLFSVSPISSLNLGISHFLCLKQLPCFTHFSTYKAKMRIYHLFESFPRFMLLQSFLKKDYSSMNFKTCIESRNHHHNQNTKQFLRLKKSPSCYLFIVTHPTQP